MVAAQGGFNVPVPIARPLHSPGISTGFCANVTPILILALEGTATVTVRQDSDYTAEGVIVLLAPNALYRVRGESANTAVFYLSPLDDVNSIVTLMQLHKPGCWIRHIKQHSARQEAAGLIAQRVDPDIVGARLVRHLSAETCPGIGDTRVASALEILEQMGGGSTSLTDVSRVAGLSASAFRHVFKHHTGVTFRRMRLWMRVTRAIKLVRSGSSFTEAAHDAGFASSAHFSSSFRDLLGVTPTVFFGQGPRSHHSRFLKARRNSGGAGSGTCRTRL